MRVLIFATISEANARPTCYGVRRVHTQLGTSYYAAKPRNVLICVDDPVKGYVGKMVDFGHCRGERERACTVQQRPLNRNTTSAFVLSGTSRSTLCPSRQD